MKIITQLRNNYKFRIISKKNAGLVLNGNEIKSIHNHQISINDSYVFPHNRELYLYNAHISPYSQAGGSLSNYQSKRLRKILLKRTEIDHFIMQIKSKNYNLIPLRIFINERGWVKAEIALVQGLKKHQIKSNLKEKIEKKRLQRKEYE